MSSAHSRAEDIFRKLTMNESVSFYTFNKLIEQDIEEFGPDIDYTILALELYSQNSLSLNQCAYWLLSSDLPIDYDRTVTNWTFMNLIMYDYISAGGVRPVLTKKIERVVMPNMTAIGIKKSFDILMEKINRGHDKDTIKNYFSLFYYLLEQYGKDKLVPEIMETKSEFLSK